MRYLPHTPEDITAMLEAIGKPSVDELFQSIPEAARFSGTLALEPSLGEAALMRHLKELSRKNSGAELLSFLGAGMYAHHIPPAVDQLLLRSEFYTSYTPYQPEVAQGTLQAIWEYQTIVSELYGLPLSNASLYDGASATAEAALMACRLTKRGKIVLCHSVHPDYRAVTATYLAGRDDMSCVEVPFGADGAANFARAGGGHRCRHGGRDRRLPELRRPALRSSSTGAARARSGLALGHRHQRTLRARARRIAGGPGRGHRGRRRPGDRLPAAIRRPGRWAVRVPRRAAILAANAWPNLRRNRGQQRRTRFRAHAFHARAAHSPRARDQQHLHQPGTARVVLGDSHEHPGQIRVHSDCRALLGQGTLPAGRDPRLARFLRGFGTAPFFNEFAVRVPGGSAARVCRKLEQQGLIAGFDLGRADATLADRLLIAVTEQHRREDLDRLVGALAEFS